jgi:catechol 2,3-dioxygenase-like lactoylglutathione lyase family enzyme
MMTSTGQLGETPARSGGLASRHLFGFVPTADPVKARAFFGGTLGLRMIQEDQFMMVFDANGTKLRVVTFPSVTPAPLSVVHWEVPDIAAAVQDLTRAGVTFERYEKMVQDELGVWKSWNGSLVAWFKDPDGNILSLTQF